ncbi:MAG: DtxR family Mn-dependent transcriptional regulator, partial [Arenicella sp.]
GDPIPDKDGKIDYQESKVPLSETAVDSLVEVVQVSEDSYELLQYLDQINLALGSSIKVLERITFDESISVELNGKQKISLSKKVAENIAVKFKSK